MNIRNDLRNILLTFGSISLILGVGGGVYDLQDETAIASDGQMTDDETGQEDESSLAYTKQELEEYRKRIAETNSTEGGDAIPTSTAATSDDTIPQELPATQNLEPPVDITRRQIQPVSIDVPVKTSLVSTSTTVTAATKTAPIKTTSTKTRVVKRTRVSRAS